MKWDSKLYKNKHAFVFEYGESLVDVLDPKPEETILDLGCGTGELTYSISKKTLNIIGMDYSPEMIASAKVNFPEIQFFVKDAANFNFDIQFDSIFSNATLHWILDYKSCVKSMYHNLKPNGKLIIEFGGKDNVGLIVKTLRNHLKQYGYIEQSQLKQWYFPSIGEYCQVLEKVGFRVTLAQHYDRPTELRENNNGIKDWLEMFAKNFFFNVNSSDKAKILDHIQEDLRPRLFSNGKWFADYKRLRIIAIKQESL
ncbi:Cyclopropane-fatty-acyl-phospholipid synthase [Flavobacteriales bacterium ALC-1]|nr:Cyclopropane-fatty-acyl-phospholipid synthase [Flavobacteriales bacterium ALC-1]